MLCRCVCGLSVCQLLGNDSHRPITSTLFTVVVYVVCPFVSCVFVVGSTVCGLTHYTIQWVSGNARCVFCQELHTGITHTRIGRVDPCVPLLRTPSISLRTHSIPISLRTHSIPVHPAYPAALVRSPVPAHATPATCVCVAGVCGEWLCVCVCVEGGCGEWLCVCVCVCLIKIVCMCA